MEQAEMRAGGSTSLVAPDDAASASGSAPRVAMLGSWPPFPGISAYCFELAHAVGRNAKLDYISFSRMYPDFLYPGGACSLDHSFPPIDPNRVRLRQTLSWYNPFGWVREGMRPGADVLHAQFWSLPLAPVIGTVMAGWRLRRKPCVLTIHNAESHDRPVPFRAALRTLVGLSTAVVVHTTDAPSWLQRHCRAAGKKLWTIPHGPLHLYRDDSLTPQQARRTLGVPPDAPTVLFFGSIRRYKGLDVLLKAFAKVRDRVPAAHLIIAGRPWESFDPYQRIIEDFGLGDRVRTILGYIPTEEVKLYFTATDLVVLPYRSFAAQSGVGLTATAFDKPVVATRVGGLPDLPLDERWIVEPDDPSALADALALALQQRKELLLQAESATQRREALNWEAIAERTIAVYREVCGRGRP